MKSWIFVIILWACFFGQSTAAKLEVSSFKLDENDQTAINQKKINTQRQVCALIKLEVPVGNFKITANPAITASVRQPDSSYFLYVSPTQVTFTINAPGYERLTYETDFLQSARVYQMKVVIADSVESKGAIYVKSDPLSEVFLNDSSKGHTPCFITSIPTGDYSVRLKAEGYRDYVNNKVVVESGKTTDVIVNLNALAGGRPATAPVTPAVAVKTKTPKERRPQDNGWFVGISLGAIFPNNYPANYYNGSPENENSFNRIFQTYPGYTSNAYQDIYTAIGSRSFDTTNIGYPRNMAYNVAANLGAYGGYIFKKKNRIFVSFDYHRLKTNGTLILYYDQITPGNKDNYYDKSSVHGMEDRFNINLLYTREFKAGEYTNWYLLGGLNLNNTVVKSNFVTIPYNNNSSLPPLEYNIKYTYYDATGAAYTDYVEGGIGYGASAGIGLRLMFNKSFSLDPEVQFFYSNVHLNGYEQFKPSLQINLRINLFTAWRHSNNPDDED